MGRLEDKVAQERGLPLVLRTERVLVPSVEGRALGDVRGVVFEERGEVAIGYAREVSMLIHADIHICISSHIWLICINKWT